MQLENLSHSEAERLAYLTGDTVAAIAFAHLVDDASEHVGSDAPDEALQHAYAVLEAGLYAIASAVHVPGTISRASWQNLSRCLTEMLACPADFEVDAMRARIYRDLGCELR